MSAEDLISRLSKCRETGRGQWIACCPAHQDKNPSMTIKELPDGTVLLHCFAGCEALEILGAIGLDFETLFPPKEKTEYRQPFEVKFNPYDVLAAIHDEAMVLSVIALDIGKGLEMPPETLKRALDASRRIREGVWLVNHGKR